MGDILAVIVPGRTVAIGKQSPLTIKDRVMIEDRSPARILLLGSIHNAIIDMQGIHDIGIIDGVITDSNPTGCSGRAAPG